MSRRTSFPYLISFVWLFSVCATVCLADEEAEIHRAKESIFSLIETGKFAEARSATDRFVIEFTGYEKLPESLYWIADRYKRLDRFEDAKLIYQKIVQDYPESSWAKSAKLGISRAEVKSLVVSQDFEQAGIAFDKLIADFAQNPELPEAIFWITERYERMDRFDEARERYQGIIDDFPDSPWAKSARMAVSRAEVKKLIVSGEYDEAQEAFDKFVADFAKSSDLPEAVYWIAERYERAGRAEEAKQNYQRIMQNYPYSFWAKKAKLGIPRAEAISLVMSQDYDGAQKSLDKLAVDFGGHPDLPETIYWITERYERAGRFEDAKHNYEQLIQNYPYNPFAKKARLGIPRAEVISIIMSQNYDRAKESLDKLALDFSGHPDLPETLYWIAERYKDASRPEDVNRIYRQIVQNYPDHPYATRARSSLERDGVIFPVTVQDSNETAESNNTVPVEVLEQEKKAVELYRIARSYEEDPNKGALAKQVYEQIVDEYPGTIKASNAVLDVRRLEIQEAFNTRDANTVQLLMDKFIADFKQNSYVGACLNELAERFYLTAIQLQRQKQSEKSQDYYSKAESVFLRIIDSSNNLTADNNLPTENLGGIYYYTAGCRQQQGKWDGAIEYFQKVIEDYPDFEYACGAQAAVGWCCEVLRDSNQAPKEAINPIIEEAYKAVLTNYTDCYAAGHAAYRLAEMSVEKGNRADAIAYYRKFLEVANPQDSRIEAVKVKLTELEETNQ